MSHKDSRIPADSDQAGSQASLSALWAGLVEQHTDNPLHTWLSLNLTEDRLQQLLRLPVRENPMMDFWRVMVARKLQLTAKCTSLDLAKKTDPAVIQACLLEPLNAFICGQPDYEDIWKSLSGGDDAVSVCGHVFAPGEPNYSCRECVADPTCVMCDSCFQQSVHVNHRYKVSTSEGFGGFCDCGDPEAFREELMCRTHRQMVESGMDTDQAFQKLPTALQLRVRWVLMQVLNYIFQVTSPKWTPDLRLNEAEKAICPELQNYSNEKTYCLVLCNDHIHSISEVITTLKYNLRFSQKKAIDLTEFVDTKGRAIILVDTYEACATVRDRIENASKGDRKSLQCRIVSTYRVLHESFAVCLLDWLAGLLKSCPAFRSPLCQILFSEVLAPVLPPDPVSDLPCERVLLGDTSMWKELRKAWHGVLVQGVLKDYEAKKSLAKYYVLHYDKIMDQFVEDDQESDASITNLSVQFFTTPSIAHWLIWQHDALFAMAHTFHKYMQQRQDGEYGDLSVEMWIRDDQSHYDRCSQILLDLHYLLFCPPSEAMSDALRCHFIRGVEQLCHILACIQGIDQQTRKVGEHVEMESTEWKSIFKLITQLITILKAIPAWCRHDKRALVQVTSMVARFCHQIKMARYRIVECHFTTKSSMYGILVYDTLTRPMSIHWPLHRLLANLLSCFSAFPDALPNVVKRLQEHGNLLELVDPIISHLTMMAQVKIGLWRRNGSSMDAQLLIYENPLVIFDNPLTGHYFKESDLLLVQTLCGLLASKEELETLMVTMMKRFGVLDLVEGKVYSDEDVETVHAMADEWLTLLLGILMERVTLGSQARDAQVEHVIIHGLAIDAFTHSQICKWVHVEEKREALIDESLKKVADLISDSRDRTKNVYKLKKEFVPCYNPFYYFYNRILAEKAKNNMMAPVKSEASAGEVMPLCVPPRLSPLLPMYQPLVTLTATGPVLQMIYIVLKWFQGDTSHQVSSSDCSSRLLHKVFYLLLIGYQDDLDYSTGFTASAEEIYLVELLHACQAPDDLKSLLQHCIAKAVEARASLLNLSTEVDLQNVGASAQTEADEAQQRKRRALESRAKLLAEMSRKQHKFSDLHAQELGEIEREEKVPMSEPLKSCFQNMSGVGDTSAKSSIAVAVGALKHGPLRQSKLMRCSFCKVDQNVGLTDVTDPLFILLCYCSKSACLRQRASSGTGWRDTNPYHLSADLNCGPIVTTCGHGMHSSCFLTFCKQFNPFGNTSPAYPESLPLNQFEFLCPTCQRVCHTILPILPPVYSVIPSLKTSSIPFEKWLDTISLAVQKAKVFNSASFASLTLVEHKSGVASLPGLPGELCTYLFKFGFNNCNAFLIEDDASRQIEDCKLLQLCFQAAAMALHWTQACRQGSDSEEVLLHPINSFFQECLHSLVKTCFMMPLSQVKQQVFKGSHELYHNYMECNAVYLYSAILTDDMDQTFLELDMVCVLLCLLVATPTLQPERQDYGLGEHDAHVLHLCLVVHLIQVLAGLQPTDASLPPSSAAKDNAAYSKDDMTVQFLTKKMGEVFAWSDVQVAGVKDVSGHVIRSKMLHFLRCAALAFHIYSDVPFPTRCTEYDTFTTLMTYLGMPTSLYDLINVAGSMDLVDRLLSNDSLKDDGIFPKYPVVHRELIDLPDNYIDVLKMKSSCPNSFNGERKSPSLCLVCGTIVCSQYCLGCTKWIYGKEVGGCCAHAHECSGDIGIFLRIKHNTILLLHRMKRGEFISSPYVDQHGESDDNLRRGNPLHLNRALYDSIKQMWANNSIPLKVNQKLSWDSELSAYSLLDAQWQTM